MCDEASLNHHQSLNEVKQCVVRHHVDDHRDHQSIKKKFSHKILAFFSVKRQKTAKKGGLGE